MWYSLILDLLCVETVYRLLPFCVDLRTVLRTKKQHRRIQAAVLFHSFRLLLSRSLRALARIQ